MTKVHFIVAATHPSSPPGTCGTVLDEAFWGQPVCQLDAGHDGFHFCGLKSVRIGVTRRARDYIHHLAIRWEEGDFLGQPLRHIAPSSYSEWSPMSRVKPRGTRQFRLERSSR